jgi:hypothetical protein
MYVVFESFNSHIFWIVQSFVSSRQYFYALFVTTLRFEKGEREKWKPGILDPSLFGQKNQNIPIFRASHF